MDEEMGGMWRWRLERNPRGRAMTPDDARCAALRQFGGVDQLKERERDARGWMWLEQLGKDFRFTIRSLTKSPGYTLSVVATLGPRDRARPRRWSALPGRRLLPVAAFPDEGRLSCGRRVQYVGEISRVRSLRRDMWHFAPHENSFLAIGGKRSEQMNLVR